MSRRGWKRVSCADGGRTAEDYYGRVFDVRQVGSREFDLLQWPDPPPPPPPEPRSRNARRTSRKKRTF